MTGIPNQQYVSDFGVWNRVDPQMAFIFFWENVIINRDIFLGCPIFRLSDQAMSGFSPIGGLASRGSYSNFNIRVMSSFSHFSSATNQTQDGYEMNESYTIPWFGVNTISHKTTIMILLFSVSSYGGSPMTPFSESMGAPVTKLLILSLHILPQLGAPYPQLCIGKISYAIDG